MHWTREIALLHFLTMFAKMHRQLSRIRPRAYAIFAELLLIAAGAALVIYDFAYIPDPLYTIRFADIYIYLILGGVIAAWSIFGLLATLKHWCKGVKVYLYALTALAGIQICLGVIHIILLFTLYRKRFVTTCTGHVADKYFWSSLGYDYDDEDDQATDHCVVRWSTYAVQRTLVWAVFSAILVLSALMISRYHTSLSEARHQALEASGWSEQDTKPIITVDSGEGDASEKSRCTTPPPIYSEVNEDVNYRQRERLYSEISRQRTNRLQSQYQVASSQSSSNGSVHPLDIRRRSGDSDEEEYVPPSPPPPRKSTTVDDPLPFEALSTAERMEYDLFRSRPHRLSVHRDDDETIGTMSRRRNKPQWFQEEHETLLEEQEDSDSSDGSSSSSSADGHHAR